MTKADVIASASGVSVASTGLGIRYIGTEPMLAYAYSGAVSVNATLTDLLLFTTGAGVIEAEFVPFYMTQTLEADDFLFKVSMNGIFTFQLSAANNYETYPRRIRFIIPPFTKFHVQSKNLTEDEAWDMGCKLTGRVYGAE